VFQEVLEKDKRRIVYPYGYLLQVSIRTILACTISILGSLFV
jgi:hypothetical protein